MAFKARGEMLRDLERNKDNWHLALIIGHQQEGPFRLQLDEKEILQQNQIVVVGQLFAENDVGHLTREFNADLEHVIEGYPNLLIKLRNLQQTLWNGKLDINEKSVLPISILGIIMQSDQNISVQNRKMTMAKIQNMWKVAPAYTTRERDNIYKP